MSNQGKWKVRTDINKVILSLSEAKRDAKGKQLLEIVHIIVELAAIRERISKVLDESQE